MAPERRIRVAFETARLKLAEIQSDGKRARRAAYEIACKLSATTLKVERVLARLPQLDAAGYAMRRGRIQGGIVEPARALVDEVARAIKVQLTTARGSVSPLHADLRFAPAGSPRYKDHLLLTAWHGTDEKSGPTLWIRIDSRAIGFASGIALTPAGRDRWREAVGGAAGARLASFLEALRAHHSRHDLEVATDSVQRVPPPWPSDHPRAELLRKTGLFQVRFRLELPREVGDAAFVSWCVERLNEQVARILTDRERQRLRAIV